MKIKPHKEQGSVKKNIVIFFTLMMMLSLSITFLPKASSQTDNTKNIKILSYSWYIDSLGVLIVVGEIQNQGTNTIAAVFLSGTVYSPDGPQSSSGTQVFVANLIPQQKAPFYMAFNPPNNLATPNTIGNWQFIDISNIALTASRAETTTDYQYPDLTITGQSATVDSGTDNKGTYWVSGTVKNTGSQTAKNIRVIGTFYHSSGAVVAVGYTDILTPTSLAPSGTVSFKVGAFDLNQTNVSSDKKISKYSLLIQVEQPILQGTAPQITPYPTGNSPSDTTSPTDTQPPDSGNGSISDSTGSSPAAWVYAVVIVIVLAAIAGAVVALKKRKPDETPKKTTKNTALKKTTKKTRAKRKA
jgi:hypothetical protein